MAKSRSNRLATWSSRSTTKHPAASLWQKGFSDIIFITEAFFFSSPCAKRMYKSQLKLSLKCLSLILCLLSVATNLKAQEAFKVDEAVNPRCDLSEVPQIVDPPMPLFIALNEHKEAQAAIIVYGMQGTARRYAERVRRWLSDVRGIEMKRLVTLYGGASDVLRLELWIIPQGARLPVVNAADDYKKSARFDTYGYWDGELCGSERLGALAGFAESLKLRPHWQGYIVVRPHRNRRGMRTGDENWGPDGYISRQQAGRRATKDRRYLLKKFGLDPARIKVVVGDRDEWTHAELWLVPPGAEPPVRQNQ